ncbi:MAG: hypothetical protein V4685_01325 [Bacteroidota bacterium]
MKTEQKIIEAIKRNDNLKKGAKVALVILVLNILRHLAAIYQTRYQLISPVIPESIIWEINKQFIFHAGVSAVAAVVGLLLYFFDKYVLVIALVVMLLIADRFIYV